MIFCGVKGSCPSRSRSAERGLIPACVVPSTRLARGFNAALSGNEPIGAKS